MLCQKCQQREAKVHLTMIISDQTETQELCEECFEAQAPPEQLERIRKLRAQGGGATSGWTNYDPPAED